MKIMKKFIRAFLCIVTIFTLAFPSAAKADDTDIINLTVDSCNVQVEQSESDQFEYQYDEEKYSLTETRLNHVLTITLSKTSDTAEWTDLVIIKIPAKDYEKIVVRGIKSGISLPAGINASYDVLNDGGAIAMNIAKGFTQTIDLTCSEGSGALIFNEGATDYTLTVHSKASAIGTDFPSFKPNQQYVYTSGTGGAKITLNIKDSAFSIHTASTE